jgi:hypothetical protein
MTPVFCKRYCTLPYWSKDRQIALLEKFGTRPPTLRLFGLPDICLLYVMGLLSEGLVALVALLYFDLLPYCLEAMDEVLGESSGRREWLNRHRWKRRRRGRG